MDALTTVPATLPAGLHTSHGTPGARSCHVCTHWHGRLSGPHVVCQYGGGVLVRNAIWQHNSNIQVDSIGVGASVVDSLRFQGLSVLAMNGSESAKDKTDPTGQLGFRNSRAYWWWNLRCLLDPSNPEEDQIAIPNDRGLLADLCAPKWKVTPRGVQIESKDDIKRRLGRSPDLADSLCYATCQVLPPPKRGAVIWNIGR